MFVRKETPPTLIYNDAKFRQFGGTVCSQSGSSSITETTTALYSANSRWMEGETLKDFHKRRRSGAILPMTNWKQYEWYSTGTPNIRQFCSSAGKFGRWENRFHHCGTWTYPSFDVLEDALPSLDLQYFVQQAAARISSGGWDALTFVAEIGQLRRMLKGVFTKLLALSQGSSPGKLADLWLEGRYGWRTLLYDIQDLNEAIKQLNSEKRTRYSEKVGLSTTSSFTESFIEGTPKRLRTNHVEIRISARGAVVADIDIPALQIDPIRTAWELTTLSFVLDWLLNVGQALDAVSFLLHAKSYTAAGGFRAEFSVESNVSVYDAMTYTQYTESGTASASGFIERRVPMTVSSLPRLKLRLDEWKIIDLASLVYQRLSTRR